MEIQRPAVTTTVRHNCPTSLPLHQHHRANAAKVQNTTKMIIQGVSNAGVSTAHWAKSSVAMQLRYRPPCCSQIRNNKHPA
jgi:hypothetical protein